MSAAPPYRAYTLTIPVSIRDGCSHHMRVSSVWPLTPDEWDRMMLVLEAMRPGLVIDPQERLCAFLASVLAAS